MKKNRNTIALFLLSIIILQYFSAFFYNLKNTEVSNDDFYKSFKNNNEIYHKKPKTQNSYPTTLLIDDMEDINDWFNTSFISNSTDCTEGSNSLNMSANSLSSSAIIKDITAYNFSRYDKLEFDLKITGTYFTSFMIAIRHEPMIGGMLWYRNYRDFQWHHVVIDLRNPARVNVSSVVDQYLTFLIGGDPIYYKNENFSVLIDNVFLSSSGIRLTPDSEYKDISAGGSVNFSIELEHIHGTENENFSITLVKNSLYEFDAELNCSLLSIPPNESAFFKVIFTALENISIDETETITVIAQSTSQLGKNYSIYLTCGAKTYGDRIYFMSNYQTEYYEIYSMNPDGTDVIRLTYQEINKSAPLCLSPDGTLLAYSASNNSQPVDPNKEIWILNLTDMTTRQITHNKYHDEHPDFSPNGKELCFFSKHGGGENFSIYTIGINGSNEKEITPSELNLNCFDPAWSRNGTEIVFVAFPPGTTDLSDRSVIELYLINVTDSNDLIKITNNNKTESDPYWSKNDNFIIYARYLGPGNWDNHSNIFVNQYPFEIVQYNRTKGQEINLVNTTGYSGSRYVGIPIYSPDNQKISYFRHNNEYLIFNLYIDDRKGITEKINLPFEVVWADWGPRRDYISRPDLAVVIISYNPANPIYGIITAKIKNVGDANLTSAQIQFSDGHPKSGGTLIGELKTISNLEPNQEIEITSDSWLNPTNGEHQIYVTVLNSTPREDNTQNNRNNIKIFVKALGTFTLDSDDDDDNDDIIESINGYTLVIFFSLIIGIIIILIKKRKLKISTK